MRHACAALVALAACRDPAPAAPPDARRPAPPPAAPAPAPRPARTPPRDAAPAPDVAAADVAPSPTPHGPAAPVTRGFLGLDDDATLARICDAPFARVERNRGGSTVSFKVRFENNQKALFKPQQRSEIANYRAELAAYRVSRLLGLHRVPPACGRLVARDLLQRAGDASGDAAFSQRVLTELLGRNDRVPGAVLFWVPGALEPVPGAESYAELLDPARPLDPARAGLAADLSALLLFDFLNDNVDRWSGGNILRQRAEGANAPGPMLFMDNGASFSAINDGRGARPAEQARRLAAIGRFPRALVASLRALTADSLRAAVAEDPLGPCLSAAQIDAVLTRRDLILARVDAVVRERGEAEALCFP
ncbi:MAG: hypothetical protein U0324_33180 [Polyangiales bacterium]